MEHVATEVGNIVDLLENGHWAEAQDKFKSINPSPREFGDVLDNITDIEMLRDMALLGFYCRDYQPKKD